MNMKNEMVLHNLILIRSGKLHKRYSRCANHCCPGTGWPANDPPVNIEIASEDFDDLTKTAAALKNYLDSIQVPGVEELKMDVDLTNPEITLTIDREKANTEGVSTDQIGNEIRTAVFGREVSKIKEGEDEYKIQLRNKEMERQVLLTC